MTRTAYGVLKMGTGKTPYPKLLLEGNTNITDS